MPIVPGVLVALDEERVAARDDEPGRGVAREVVVAREGFACVRVVKGRFGSHAGELRGGGGAPDQAAVQDLIERTVGADEKGTSIPVRAIAEGRIRSVDDPAAAYVSTLAGTEYGRTPVRHLPQMSSGVRFDEHYSGRDDLTRLLRETIDQVGPGGVDAVKPYNERVRPSGTVFSYASGETQVLGLASECAGTRRLASDRLRSQRNAAIAAPPAAAKATTSHGGSRHQTSRPKAASAKAKSEVAWIALVQTG